MSNKMSDGQLCKAISEETGLSVDTVKRTLTSFKKTIIDNMDNNVSTTVHGLGTFSTKHSAARTGKNPQTGEKLDIPARDKLAFKCTSALVRIH